MRAARFATLLAALIAMDSSARAGGSLDAAPAAAPDHTRWTVDASAYAFFLTDETDYVQLELDADRGWLHLAVRYNYEDLDTGSVWVGYNLRFGDRVELDLTPMLGGVFGNTRGVAPGYLLALDWWRLGLYTEGELVFDTDEREGSFFYSWSELTVAPLDWLRAGLVAQRTRVYESPRDIQRGVLLGVSVGLLELTGHVLDPDEDGRTFVFSVGAEF